MAQEVRNIDGEWIPIITRNVDNPFTGTWWNAGPIPTYPLTPHRSVAADIKAGDSPIPLGGHAVQMDSDGSIKDTWKGTWLDENDPIKIPKIDFASGLDWTNKAFERMRNNEIPKMGSYTDPVFSKEDLRNMINPTYEDQKRIAERLEETFRKVIEFSPTPDLSIESVKKAATKSEFTLMREAIENARKRFKELNVPSADAIKIATEQVRKSLKTFKTEKMSEKAEKSEPEIIGYDFKTPEFLNAAVKLTGYNEFENWKKETGAHLSVNSEIKNSLLALNVFYAWTTPVYEKKEEKNFIDNWYKDVDGSMFYVKHWLDVVTGQGYGILKDTWKEVADREAVRFIDPKKASQEEVVSALTAQANRQGFRNEQKVKDAEDDVELVEFNRATYDPEYEAFWLGDAIVMKKGKWVSSDYIELPEIGGEQGKDMGEELHWGCYEVSKKDVRMLNDMSIQSFKIYYDDREIKIGKKKLNQIYKYLQNDK